MSGQNVAWGKKQYDPNDDAIGWLERSPQSGPAIRTALDSDLARRLAEGLTRLPFATWNFGDSVAFDALVELTEQSGEERWASFVQGWGRAWATRAEPFVRLDCTAPGHALVRVAQRYGDARLLEALTRLASYLRARPLLHGVHETWASSPLLPPYGEAALSDLDRTWLQTPPPGIFVDCLHFDPPFFVRLGIAIGDTELVDAGVEQARRYIDALQRPDGLFDHFRLAGAPRSFGPGWGRGQGWALLGLLDVIADHPDAESSSGTADLRAAAQRLITAMVALQRADGHWPVVVTSPESGDEFSTTAFMAAGFQRAARLGIVAHETVENSVSLALSALTRSFDEGAQLREVSAAVYASTVDDHYRHVPRGYVVPWGQGPALLAVLAAQERDTD